MEEFMESLWSCLPSAEDNALIVLDRIIQHLRSGLTSEERDVALHLMFQEERGIQSFLSAAVKGGRKKIASNVLTFVLFLLDWFICSLENYVVPIKNIAFSFIRSHSSSADEKDKSLDILIAIFKSRICVSDIDPPSIINQLLSMASYRLSKPTVLRKVYTLIGVMAEQMPLYVDPKSEHLLKRLMADLDYQITTTNKVEFSIIEGCFDGLYHFLASFPLDGPANIERCKNLANYIKDVLKLLDTHRKTAARAALNVLARHGDQLKCDLVPEFQEWHKILGYWLRFGKEERIVAKQALLAFYHVLAMHISSKNDTQEMLMFFCTHFKSQFETSEDVDIAVKGFGSFAKALKRHKPEEIPVIFNILAQKSHEECGKGNHHKIADYLDSLSVFSAESGVIHNLQIAILEGLSVQLICQFAQEDHPTWQTVMVDAVISTLLNLSRCSGSALDMYMNTVVHQGIIRSVSHPVVEDAELFREAGQKKITTYENYLAFWQSLITMNRSSRGMYPQDLSKQRNISRKLVDKIIESVMEIINRLDLTLKDNKNESSEPSEPIYHCDVEKCVGANSPKDFTVLVNLVNFTTALLNNLPDQSLLMKWISPLIQRIIRLSSRHPLVSSFYKLLATIVWIAQKLGYFDDQKDEMEDVDWRPTVNLLSGFLYDVITQQSQYRGDLQVSCLHLMLATPSRIAIILLIECAPAFQTVFRLGCSMLSLAQEGLQTLARWNQELPQEKMRVLLQAVLPSFDILLQTKGNVTDEEYESNLSGRAMVKKVLQDQKRTKLWKPKLNAHIETELGQLQKEIILFLSTLDSATCLFLLDGSEDRLGVTAWQEEKLLMFPLPYPDMKVELSLDDMLPHLAHLAEHCSDRRTRSAACELLHAVIMFMLGKEKQLELAQQGRLTSLWIHLFPTILRLACDMDLIVSQLFAPLGEQMAHWYSSRMHERSEQAAAFLTALHDGITHPTDAALRDYSASCLHEYVEWSKRQRNMKVKVEPVIKFIASLCHHPCPQKRMGAALAFNSMYSVLRESVELIDEFWIELLYCLVTGLSLCSVTGEDSHTEVQLEKSLNHISRVLRQCSNKFNLDSECRRVPKEFSGGTLWHVVRWLLQYCTALNSACRVSCRKLVIELADYVTGCRSAKDFILGVQTTEGTDKLVQIVEGSPGLLTTLPKSAPWDQALAWVYSLLASMECYMWLIGTVRVPSEVLLIMENCKLMQALSHFLEGVVNSKIDQTTLWRPKAMENFNLAKCCTVVRMIEFLTLILDNNQGGTLDSFWSMNFWEVLISCCLWPSHVGFNSTSKTVEDNLPKTVEEFLKSLVSHLSEPIVNGLKDLLKEKVSLLAPEMLERFPKSIRSGIVLSKDRDLVRGLRVLQTVFEEAQTWSGLVGDASLQLVFQSIVEPIAIMTNDQLAPVELTPLAAEHATSMLELFLTLSSETRSLIELTTDNSVLHQRGLQGDLTHGEHFVSCFKVTLVRRLLEQPLKSLCVFEELLCSTTSPRDLTILPSLLKSDFRPKSGTWDCLQELVVCIFSKWERFVSWAQNDCAKETWLISLLTQIVKLDMEFQKIQNCENVCGWITFLLQDSSRSLTLKTDLLHCLPIVCSNPTITDIKTCLHNVKDQHFPSSCSEFKKGSQEFLNFVRAFEALLQSLVITGNQVILQIVIKIMSVDAKHACRHLLPNTLEKFMKQLKDKQDCQVQSLMLVYTMFDNEMLSIDYRICILNDFLLKLMHSASLQSQIEFAKLIIKKLVEAVKQQMSASLNTGRGNQRLCTQLGSWKLLQQIYSFPIKSLFEEKGSPLVKAAFSGTDIVVESGRELTGQLTKRALGAFQNPPNCENVSDQTREMCREYLCAVYNMFATLVCNLKTEPSDAKFYDKLLFDEKSKKIWRLLVDDRKCYMLPYRLTEHLRNVEKAVCIRRKLTEERQSALKLDARRTLHLLESQSFAGSLETDITRFDFTHSRLLNTPGSIESNEEKSVIVLENDILNDHECMATVCSVIRHLVDSGISPLPVNGVESALPGWMSSFRNSLLDQTNPRNSHIFMLRVVLNCETHFSPYAAHWIDPLLNCIVKRLLENGISYLLGDIICLLSKWSLENPSVKVQQSQANKLLQYVIENCVDTQRVVFKYHLELIKSILEVWKKFIVPPHDLLLKMLHNTDKRVGINLTAIMLWHDLIPWTVHSKNFFISFLQNNLQDNTKEVFKASSETLGLCLKHLSKANDGQLLPEEEIFINNLVDVLKSIHLKQRDCDRFLTVLFGVHENYPPIVDHFVPVILFYLDQSRGDSKAVCLSLLAEHLEFVGEKPFQELKGRGLLVMMSDSNLDIQINALQIAIKLAPSLPEADLYEVIHELSTITRFVKGKARSLVHEVSLICFDRYSIKQEDGTLSDFGRKIYDESKALLLSGLVDSNVELQKKCYAKWTEEERLPTHAPHRLSIMFSLMYSPLTEQYFLSYIVPLMLEGTSCTPDFQSTVFAHALDECVFQDQTINNDWNFKNAAAMVPMFAQTFASQVAASQTSSLNSSFDASNPLLATQYSLIFQPTADFVDGDVNAKSQFKVNSSMARSGFLFSQDAASYGTQSSLKNNYKQGQGFGTQRLRFFDEQSSSEIQTRGSGSTLKLNRFLGKNTASQVFGSANVRRAKIRNEMWQNRARKREAQVSLSRKYRKGDLPDIQIKVSDFINPLKELAKRDVVIAKQVMVNLFVGVKRVVCSPGDSDCFESDAASLLNNILESSTSYEPSTIGLCLEIAYHCQINLNPEQIYEAAVGSDLLALGVLLLEKTASECENAENVWVHLAQMFDGLGERNVAHATLLHNVELGEKSKAALSAHADEQWLKAKKLYYEALSETQYDSFYESCFECMETLSEWDNINKVIRGEVDEKLDNLWDMGWYERKLLPRLIHSEVLSLIHEGKDEHRFLTVLNNWLSDEVKSTNLKGRFSDMLSILCLLKKNFTEARFYGSKTLSEFVDRWNELSPLFRRRREVILMDIHKSAEVMGFFSDGRMITPEECHAYIKKLEKVLPTSQDSLIQWETRISYRIACMNRLPEEFQTDVKEATINMQLSLVEAALKQQNHHFAKKYLSYLKNEIGSASSLSNTRWCLAQCLERHQWAKKEKNTVKCLDNLIKVWKNLDSVVAGDIKSSPDLSVTAHSAESDLSFSIRQLLLQNPSSLTSIKDQSEVNYDWLCKKLQLQSTSPSDDFVTTLESIGLASLIDSKNTVRNYYSERQTESENIAEANFQIAQYCRKILDAKPDPTSTEATVTFSRPLVRAILSAMKFGSTGARQLFPLLLQLPSLSSDLSKDFKEKSDSVPVWMFLGWIPQILALLDTAVDVIGPLLVKIAKKYPNAVSYPYSISRENNLEGTVSRLRTITKLDSLLESSSLHSQFVRALSSLTHPSVILKHYLDKLTQTVGSSQIDWNCIEQVCDTLAGILNVGFQSSTESGMTGRFFKSIQSRSVSNLFQELHGAVKKNSKPSVLEILKKLKQLCDEAHNTDQKNIKSYAKLKDFSPWLANFSSSKMNMQIEIPGQYSGDQKPTPERHVMISRFEDAVHVMPSIRKPVKLTIIGSDAKAHNFLVKFGEDLRQDERVQQLLGLMNGIFSRNHLCRHSHLSVVTYKVVPLSSSLGIIEWVDKTCSLKELMTLSLDGAEKNRVNSIRLNEHYSWLSKDGETNNQVMYGNAHNNISREDAAAQFSKLVSITRPDTLRRGLEMWSSSVEAFYWLRHSFITSYSTLCIAHWLLGIGDRHQSNCLISKRNGQCIGIDFGHAFGSATQFLPLPELMPFRLTPHIVNVAQPHGTTGFIEETMVNVLRALQTDPEVLLATMQVFIQEPSLDWLTFAKRHLDESKENPTWLPVLKIQQATRKLKGVNPVVIVKEDLESKRNSKYHAGYCRTLMGNSRHNIRAQLPLDDLTPRQQVQCLIDLATDPNVLVKTWGGWEPWM